MDYEIPESLRLMQETIRRFVPVVKRKGMDTIP